MRKSILLFLTCAALSAPAFATAIDANRWYSIVSNETNNTFPGSANEPNYFSPGNPPWSFTLLTPGILRFTDAQIAGEAYRIYNGEAIEANEIGYTGPRARDFGANCLLNPTECYQDPMNRFARLTLNLLAGTYNLRITTEDNTLFSSAAFFRVEGTFGTAPPSSSAPPPTTSAPPPTTSAPNGDPGAVPEPATFALTGVAAALLYCFKTSRKS
jgi:hypothetical protein